MKKIIFLLFVTIVIDVSKAHAEGTAQAINIIVDLEMKMNKKIKDMIAIVDPDALVVTKIELNKTQTDLVGTQISAVGMFSAKESQNIEDTDISKISVTIYTNLQKFPQPVSKIVEDAVLATTRKGKVTIEKMDASMTAAIEAQKASVQNRADGIKKIASAAEQFSIELSQIIQKAMYGLIALIFGFGIIQFLMSRFQQGFQQKLVSQLVEKLGSLQPQQNEEHARPLKAEAPVAAAQNLGQTGHHPEQSIDEEFFKQMSVNGLVTILAECYWCHKDNYAAWLWTKLMPMRRLEVLSVWPQLNAYSAYISRLTGKWERYHTDGAYLSPQSNFLLSNDDIKVIIKENPVAWGHLSLMRKQSITVSLQERVALSKYKDSSEPFEWKHKPSALRVLPVQMEVTHLSLEDEEHLFNDPAFIADEMKRLLPSLVWIALLEQADREKILSRVPAQSLAQMWIAPPAVLEKVLEGLPEKKRELVLEYSKKVVPTKTSDLLREISLEALTILELKGKADPTLETKPDPKAA